VSAISGSSPLTPAGVAVLAHGGPQWRGQARLARRLAWLSLAYMAAEGAIAVAAAVLAGSVALLGFGLDSVIEGLASIVVVWRFTGARALSGTAERRARKAVAVTFFLLAPYVTADAIWTLAAGEHSRTSWLGIGVAIASLIVMPLLGAAKKRIGRRLGSATTRGEGTQNILCAYLAAVVLAGLLASAWLGWWWLDPAVGLLIAGLVVREGAEAWHGDDCDH
jgi:divalent metal cation (Fe/Co/Zn/Cd) transporter